MKNVIDKNFMPIELEFRNYEKIAKESANYEKFYISLERNDNQFYNITLDIFNPTSYATIKYIQRYIKSLLYVVGGFRLYISGNKFLCGILKIDFSKNGNGAFDVKFMEKVYGKSFEVLSVDLASMPKNNEINLTLSKNTKGARIGLDLGGSDRKVSAVLNGSVVFSEEVIWEPKLKNNINYHYNEILSALKKAAEYLPCVDFVGISTAGVVVNNKLKISSLFIKVDEDDFKDNGENLLIRAVNEITDAPVKIANDGDVTAFAGSISLKDNCVLGIAMGTSEASGYINADGNINGYLNELAFVPVDYNENSIIDEWSGDYGVGCKYFSQDAVIKLANMCNINLSGSPAEKLKAIQNMIELNNDAKKIFANIGVYLAFTIPFYCRFYDIKYILLLGRVMSQKGGDIIIKKARYLLKKYFPNINVKLVTPNETMRRLGQSKAAAMM